MHSRRPERNKVQLVIGHTHAYDPAIRVMHLLISSGALGKLGMINCFNYTNSSIARAGGGTRHNVGRRNSVQSGAAPDRHCALLAGDW